MDRDRWNRKLYMLYLWCDKVKEVITKNLYQIQKAMQMHGFFCALNGL